MKRVLYATLGLGLTGSLFLACDTKDDPDTIARNDLSPPLNLVTVTGDNAVELRWSAQNFEGELQGYHVFLVPTTLTDMANDADSLPQYPPLDYTATQLTESSIPRCEDNDAFFKKFGITVDASASCGESLLGLQNQRNTLYATANSPAAQPLATRQTFLLQDEEQASILDAKATCYDPDKPDTALGNDNISLPKNADNTYQDGEGTQRCLIKSTADGTALSNGTTYVFMVVAVLGSDFDEISWSSNLVEDTPAKPVYSNDEVTIQTDQYVTLTLASDPVNGDATLSNGFNCTAATTTGLCSIGGTNTDTVNTGASDLVLARDIGNSYPQRLFVSSQQGASIRLLYRGPITFDPVKGANTIATRVPGDEAIASNSSYVNGTTIPIYDNSVVDIAYTVNGETYYGKLIIDELTYASDSAAANVTFKATVVLQSKAGSLHYMRPVLRQRID
jgi:hypothetical protein